MAGPEDGDFNYLHKHIKIYLHVEQISMKTSWTLARDSYKIKTVRKIHTESNRKVKESSRSRYMPLGGDKGSEGKRDYVGGGIEENNRMRKNRDLFKKTGDTKGIVHEMRAR